MQKMIEVSKDKEYKVIVWMDSSLTPFELEDIIDCLRETYKATRSVE